VEPSAQAETAESAGDDKTRDDDEVKDPSDAATEPPRSEPVQPSKQETNKDKKAQPQGISFIFAVCIRQYCDSSSSRKGKQCVRLVKHTDIVMSNDILGDDNIFQTSS